MTVACTATLPIGALVMATEGSETLVQGMVEIFTGVEDMTEATIAQGDTRAIATVAATMAMGEEGIMTAGTEITRDVVILIEVTLVGEATLTATTDVGTTTIIAAIG
mmetsp:Transcript_38259/g.82902  ORF Transcript_38259/g.82902 Transcript_38259/m.82902 type:complete len:107 (-) Transcript_38259:4-324(-)